MKRCLKFIPLILPIQIYVVACSADEQSTLSSNDLLAKEKWIEVCKVEQKKNYWDISPDFKYLLKEGIGNNGPIENYDCEKAYNQLQRVRHVRPNCSWSKVCGLPQPDSHITKAIAWAPLKNAETFGQNCRGECELGLLKYLPRLKSIVLYPDVPPSDPTATPPTFGLDQLHTLGPQAPALVEISLPQKDESFYNVMKLASKVDKSIPLAIHAEKACIHDLRPLERLENLVELNMGRFKRCYTWDGREIITPRHPVKNLNFAKLYNLRKLNLPLADFNLIRPIRRLQDLDMSGSRIQSFAPLAKHKLLRRLIIENVPDHEDYNNLHMKPEITEGVTDAHLKELGELPLLEELRLQNKNTSKVSLQLEGNLGFPRLRRLELQSLQGSYQFSGANQIKYLRLMNIGEIKLSDVSGYQKLKLLQLQSNTVHDIDKLADLKDVIHLELHDVKLQDAAFLSTLPELETLWLVKNKLASLEFLKTGFAKLTKLHLEANGQFSWLDNHNLEMSRRWQAYYAGSMYTLQGTFLSDACKKSLEVRGVARLYGQDETLAQIEEMMATICQIKIQETRDPIYPSGNRVQKLKKEVFYPNGKLYLNAEEIYYPNGQLYQNKKAIYYPNGQIFKGLDKFVMYYPSGIKAADYTEGSGGYRLYYYPGATEPSIWCGSDPRYGACLTVKYPDGSYAYQYVKSPQWQHPTRKIDHLLNAGSKIFDALQVILDLDPTDVPIEFIGDSRLLWLLNKMHATFPANK